MSALENDGTLFGDEPYVYEPWGGRENDIVDQVEMTGNAAIVSEVYDCLGRGDLECAMRHFSEEAQVDDVPDNVAILGRDGIRRYLQGWLNTIPDGQVEISDVAESGDRVVVEFHRRGTFAGREIDLRCCDVVQFSNRRIVNLRSYYDMAALSYPLDNTLTDMAA